MFQDEKGIKELTSGLSDIGGNGGNIYLLDYEDLKKAMNEATGAIE